MNKQDLTIEEKMLHMFEVVHGKMSRGINAIYVAQDDDDDDSPKEDTIFVMKDECVAWSDTKSDLFFDYLTRNLNMWEIKHGEERQGGVSQ